MAVQPREGETEMAKPMKIYVSGAYTPSRVEPHDAARIAHQNTLKAIDVGLRLIEKGHLPFIPHLTHFLHIHSPAEIPPSFWYQYDLAWLHACDAVLMMEGWTKSHGAKMEHDFALQHGKKIYYGLEEVPEVPKERRIIFF